MSGHTGPTPIGDMIDEWLRVTDLRPLAQRLADRYGPGIAATWCRAVEATCTGDTPAADAAWEILGRCGERAAGADDPARYIAAAVSRAYRAASIWAGAARAGRDRAAG